MKTTEHIAIIVNKGPSPILVLQHDIPSYAPVDGGVALTLCLPDAANRTKVHVSAQDDYYISLEYQGKWSMGVDANQHDKGVLSHQEKVAVFPDEDHELDLTLYLNGYHEGES